MNTIIYSKDFEPITAVDLPIEILESAEKVGVIMLVLKKSDTENSLVRVECKKIKWLDGSMKPVMITDDEENALLLKPDWLVGQKLVVKAYQRTLKILTDKLKKFRPED